MYDNIKGIWDGSAAGFKTCADCKSLSAEITKELELTYDEPIPIGLLRYEIDGLDCTLRFVAIIEKRGAVVAPIWRSRIAELSAGREP